MTTTRLLVLHAITPIHVGTGRGEGVIDLPVARDSVTHHPLIPGSGVKGPLRAAACEQLESAEVWALFGPDTVNASDHGSALRFSDARLIAMPVPSDAGTFAWATSPMVLARLVRDTCDLMIWPDAVREPLPEPGEDQAFAAKKNALTSNRKVILDGAAYTLGELSEPWVSALTDLVFREDEVWAQLMRERLVVLSDDAFNELARTGTDVRAHIRIDPAKGTVNTGALWYEESVPAEAVFVGVVHAVGNHNCEPDAALTGLAAVLNAKIITFGGSKSTGMGQARAHLRGGAA